MVQEYLTTAILVLNIVSLPIALFIAYKLYRVYKYLKDTNLLIISIGFIVFSIAIASTIVSYIVYTSMDIQHYTPIQSPREHKMIMGRHHDYMKRHLWPHGGESISWKILSISSTIFPLAYMFILLGLFKELTPIEYTSGSQNKFQNKFLVLYIVPSIIPVFIGDILSATMLAVIISIIIARTKGIGGLVGYTLFLLSHIIRILSIALFSLELFFIAELLRPIGLLAILMEMMAIEK